MEIDQGERVLTWTPNGQLANIQKAWDGRARENARHYIATLQADWTDEEFFGSGEATVKATS